MSNLGYMKKLPVSTAEMWRLYQTGLSAAEVGRATGASAATVKQRFRKAGKKLRPSSERTVRWYENIAKAKTRNGTWAKSAVEDRFFATLISLGLRPQRNYAVGRYAIDFAWPRKKIGVEVDSTRHRLTEEHDRQRDATLRQAGWKIFRVRVINNAGNGRRLLPPVLQLAGLI